MSHKSEPCKREKSCKKEEKQVDVQIAHSLITLNVTQIFGEICCTPSFVHCFRDSRETFYEFCRHTN